METTEKEKPANGNGGVSNTLLLKSNGAMTKSQWGWSQEFEKAKQNLSLITVRYQKRCFQKIINPERVI